MELYQSDHDGKWPSSITELEPNYLREIQAMHCGFDTQKGCSYVYYPPGQERYCGEQDLSVIVNCRAWHPDVLYSADGDRDRSRQAFLSSDLSHHELEGGRVELTDSPAK